MVKRRKRDRLLTSLAMLGIVMPFMVYMGFEGWTANGIPMQYLGVLFGGLGLLGLCGVNVWKGGPLDLRLDAEAAPVETPPVKSWTPDPTAQPAPAQAPAEAPGRPHDDTA